MQGIGNDFVMVDAIRDGFPAQAVATLARAVTDRRTGIGADGLILLERGQDAPFQMRMLNPDGSESEMCGNGIRCLARLLRDHGHSSEPQVAVDTGAGRLIVEIQEDGRVRVDMGVATEVFIDQPVATYRGTAVSMGNPHLVVFVDDVAVVNLEVEGPKLENDEAFPDRTNVHFAQVLASDRIRQRTWERGAGITLACGTGACAAAVAGFLNGKTVRKVTIELPGGDLDIEYAENGRVLMTGSAETVFEGDWAA